MMLFTVTQLKLQAHNPELSNVLKLLEKYPHAKHLNRSTNEKFVLADLQFIFFFYNDDVYKKQNNKKYMQQ